MMQAAAPDKTRPSDPFWRMRLERRIAWGVFLFFLALFAVLYGYTPSFGGILP